MPKAISTVVDDLAIAGKSRSRSSRKWQEPRREGIQKARLIEGHDTFRGSIPSFLMREIKDIEAFETVYRRDHVPMAFENLAGTTKIVATRVLGSPAGEPPFHRIAEVYFPSMEALEQCAASEGGKQTIGNAQCAFDYDDETIAELERTIAQGSGVEPSGGDS